MISNNMMYKKQGVWTGLIVLGLVFFMSLPALAAKNSDKAKSDARSDASQWVWVGYDTDQDGMIDYSEYIFLYDLQEAQKKSRERAQKEQKEQNRQMGQRSASRAAPGGSAMHRRGQKRMSGDMRTVTGRIKTLKQVNLVDMDKQHLIARVQTQDGRTARVHLGTVDELKKMDLKKGDRLSVRGYPGSLNDKGMLIAHKIRSGGKELTVRESKSGNLHKLNGEILKVKTTSFKQQNIPDQVFARIKLEDNAATIVDLGAKDTLKGIEPKDLEGKKVTLLARRVNIGDATALVARQLRVDDKTIDIDWSKVPGSAAGNKDRQQNQAEQKQQ